jgi:hypothetical protein
MFEDFVCKKVNFNFTVKINRLGRAKADESVDSMLRWLPDSLEATASARMS